MLSTTSLDFIPLNVSAVVEKVAADSPETARLIELGLTNGTTVRIIRVSPFSSPVCIEFFGNRMMVRADTLKKIFVRKTN